MVTNNANGVAMATEVDISCPAATVLGSSQAIEDKTDSMGQDGFGMILDDFQRIFFAGRMPGTSFAFDFLGFR